MSLTNEERKTLVALEMKRHERLTRILVFSLQPIA